MKVKKKLFIFGFLFVLAIILISCSREEARSPQKDEIEVGQLDGAGRQEKGVEIRGTCVKFDFNMCRYKLKPIIEDVLQGSYYSSPGVKDGCEMAIFTPNSGEKVSYQFDTKIRWATRTEALKESCQLKDVLWGEDVSWEEFKTHFNGVTNFDHVVTPRINGVENYFYDPIGISYGSFDTYVFARLFFQSPIDEGIYEINIDMRGLRGSPEEKVQMRINKLAEVANAVIPTIIDENAERVNQ